jgi:hypothetical protein
LNDIADHRERAESTEPREPADPMENAEKNEPMDPIEHAEPIEPIERNEPLLPIDNTEFSDHKDQREVVAFAGCIRSSSRTGEGGNQLRAGPRLTDVPSLAYLHSPTRSEGAER